MKNYYKILEIESYADSSTIKKAYRRLALKYHPDQNKAFDAAAKFIEITEAYEVLTEPIKKSEFDKLYQTKDDCNDHLNYKQKQWEDYGKSKANEYSNLPFDELAQKIFKGVKVGISFMPNLLAILFTIGIGMGFLAILPTFTGQPIFIIMLLAASIGAFFLSYKLYNTAKSDYNNTKNNS